MEIELTSADEGRVEEFRSGTGASFGLFDVHDVQAAFTRPVFVNHLTQNWLPALPRIQEKLDAGERVLIAEVGCGEGLAAVTIARAYPNAEIHGYDLVVAIEMLHDVPDPVGILQTMKKLAGRDGSVLVVDERTEDTGTVIRPDTMRRYAAEAGFSGVEKLDVEHPQFVLYQLT
jgi:hypothetical protein